MPMANASPSVVVETYKIRVNAARADSPGPGKRTRTSNALRHQGLNLAAIPIRLHPDIISSFREPLGMRAFLFFTSEVSAPIH